ncbi:hypothetical protein KI387_043452, partial [Taxus chinensis]
NPNPPNRPRIAPPPRQLALKAPPINATCDTKELEEEVEIEEPEEENVGDDENYLEVEEVDGDTHNGLIEYVDDEDDDDDEEAPSFSCVVFTCTESKKGSPSLTVTVKEKKEDSSVEVPQNKIISRGSPLPPSMESAKEKLDPLVSKDHAAIP